MPHLGLLRAIGRCRRSAFVPMFVCGVALISTLTAMAQVAPTAPEKVIEPDEINPKGVPAKLAKAAENPEIFVWQETNDTWRVKVRTQKKKREFTGTIKLHGGQVTKIFEFSGLEAGVLKKGKTSEDYGRWNAARDQIDFKFQTHGGDDGFSFKVDPKVESITFDLKTENAYHTDQIHIGAKAAHPPKVPFTLSTGKPKSTERPADETKDK